MIKHLLALAALALALVSGEARAQSACPYIATGAVLTAGQWNFCFSSKNDALGFIPVNRAGDTMQGKLVTATPGALAAGFNLPHGSAPSSPVNGDLWTTTGGVFAQVNGVTVQLASGAGTVLQVTNSDGTLTISPTTGNVVASLNLSNPNTWLANQALTINQSAPTNWTINNNSAGTGAALGFILNNNIGTASLNLYGGGYSAVPPLTNALGLFAGTGLSGIVLMVQNAAPIAFYQNGLAATNEVGRWDASTLGQLDIGLAGTRVGIASFRNATSGFINVQPPTGALGSQTLTLPDVTDTFAVLGTAQTFTAQQTFLRAIINGTAGAGYLEMPTQSSNPSSPSSGYRLFADSSGRLSWLRQNDGFVRTFDATLTASRVYTLQDSSDTFVMRATTDTLTNKTLTAPSINGTVGGSFSVTNNVTFSNGITNSGSYFFTGSLAALSGNGQGSLGVTTALGAILTGQGSTNDVTLQNKSGATVCQIATGGTTLNCASLSITTTLTAPDSATWGTTGIGNLTGLGMGVATPTNNRVSQTLGANNVTGYLIKRFTDTSPTGNFLDLQNAAGASLQTIDITGSFVLDVNIVSGKGITIAGAAISGNVLRGNGTRFVSAQLACADLSTPCITGNQTITLSGDVTGSGTTTITTALANIPSATPMAGSLLATNIAAPTTPAAGKTSIYVDSTSKNLAAKNDAGTVNHGVQTRTATASNWIRSIADDGSTTISQPAFTDISGTCTTAQGCLALTSAGVGDLIYASATTPTWSRLADVATGALLASGGVNTAPSYCTACTITTSITTPLHAGGTAAGSTLTLESTSGAGTTDNIQFKTGSQSLAGFIDTSQRWVIGSSTSNTPPTSVLFSISQQSGVAAPALIVGGQPMQIVSANGANTGIEIRSAGAAINYIVGGHNGGTIASPTASGSGTFVWDLSGNAYDGTVFAAGAAFAMVTNGTWTGSNHGMYMSFYTTPNGSTTATENMRLLAGLNIGGTSDPGAGSLSLNAQFFMPNITTSSAAQTGTVCWTTGTGKFTVDTTVGCLTSIGQAKNILADLDSRDALRMVVASRTVAFRYKSGYGDEGRYEQFGFIAEEMAQIDERTVGRDYDGNLRGVRYMEFTAVLSSAIKEIVSACDTAANDNFCAELKRRMAR